MDAGSTERGRGSPAQEPGAPRGDGLPTGERRPSGAGGVLDPPGAESRPWSRITWRANRSRRTPGRTSVSPLILGIMVRPVVSLRRRGQVCRRPRPTRGDARRRERRRYRWRKRRRGGPGSGSSEGRPRPGSDVRGHATVGRPGYVGRRSRLARSVRCPNGASSLRERGDGGSSTLGYWPDPRINPRPFPRLRPVQPGFIRINSP